MKAIRGLVATVALAVSASAGAATITIGGWAVGSGDLIAVGAPNEDSTASGIDGNVDNDGGDSVGAVYTYLRTGTTWAFDAYVKPSNPSSLEHSER